jgi:type IV secretion system protein TrbI
MFDRRASSRVDDTGRERMGDADVADSSPRFPVPERGAVPKPARLNRSALTIAAVVMGMLVLAAIILLPPGRPGPSAPVRAPTPLAQVPTFLDGPVRQGSTVGTTAPASTADENAARAALDSIARVGQTSPGWGAGGSAAARSPAGYGSPDAATSYALPSTQPAPITARDLQATAFQAAVMAAPTVRAGEIAAEPSASSGASIDGSPPRPAPAQAVNAGSGAGLTTTRERFRQFLTDVAQPTSTALQTDVQAPPGPYTVQAGAVIPAVLLTEVNSDLPGDVLAQVSRDVYDSRTQRTVLLPRGAKLLGRYHDQIGVGQNRLLLAWTRVLLPDGRSITLPGLPTTDPAGAGGVADQVDRHGRRAFGTAALLSLIGAGAQLSQPRTTYGPWGAPSTGEIAAGAMGQQLSTVASQLLQRDLEVQPTIRIRQGMPFNVFLTADLTLPGPYTTAP